MLILSIVMHMFVIRYALVLVAECYDVQFLEGGMLCRADLARAERHAVGVGPTG
jgi:hypothetical protein